MKCKYTPKATKKKVQKIEGQKIKDQKKKLKYDELFASTPF